MNREQARHAPAAGPKVRVKIAAVLQLLHPPPPKSEGLRGLAPFPAHVSWEGVGASHSKPLWASPEQSWPSALPSALAGEGVGGTGLPLLEPRSDHWHLRPPHGATFLSLWRGTRVPRIAPTLTPNRRLPTAWVGEAPSQSSAAQAMWGRG